MAKKKITPRTAPDAIPAKITDQLITETIEKNYMPYVMSVIVSRAIPEIDGFKPAHRKLLYTMYKMGLLNGPRTKSANVVGQTMRLHPHGDASIYDTLVRLTKGNESLLHPFIDSKGSFGKHYSRDMAAAASRYTECRLDRICAELFDGIDRDAVDMVDNYDGTMKEPALFPTSFPNILVSANMGIAVGMASNICSFNLSEVCDGTIAMLKHPDITPAQMMEYIPAPDFAGGASIIYDREKMEEIYATGRGNIKLRARYRYDRSTNCIEIIEIPYTTTIEEIIKRISQLMKAGSLREITDFRDEIDLNGFKLALEVKRGTDPDKLMAKLYKLTPLESGFACNFNVLIDGQPKQLGLCGVMAEWIRFRMQNVRRELTFDLNKKKEKLHLLYGLEKILLDIDKAISIVRNTEKDADVVPNLMAGFGIDRPQAEYVAEIKLRHLNREYILDRLAEIKDLEAAIAEINETLASDAKIKKRIAVKLLEIKKKYGIERKSLIVYSDDIEEVAKEDLVENYNVHLLMTRDGFFKKITMLSLRGNDEQKLKEGDEIIGEFDAENRDELTFVTDGRKIFRVKVSEFDTCKSSEIGHFLPVKLGLDDGEKPVLMILNAKFTESEKMCLIFENGKGITIPLSMYRTKAVRRKLSGAFSAASKVAGAFFRANYTELEKAAYKNDVPKDYDVLITSSSNKAIVVPLSLIPEKNTRTAGGVTVISLKRGETVSSCAPASAIDAEKRRKLRKTKIPAAGSKL
ncbi:MAG: topoisomerase IV [Clostridia bacterium]|nr:topoisomerase IV [Clostridia bacterium]